jgi:hypothetical protein
VDLTYRADLREFNELNFARFEAKLEQRLAELRAELLTELRTQIAALRLEFGTELQHVRTDIQELHAEVERVRSELLRWMFGFWVTTLIGIAGLLIALREN